MIVKFKGNITHCCDRCKRFSILQFFGHNYFKEKDRKYPYFLCESCMATYASKILSKELTLSRKNLFNFIKGR